MADQLPDFAPLPLNGLTYNEAARQARCGMAIRRRHWCAPVVIFDRDRLWFDNEGDLETWEATPEDRLSADWSSLAREEA